MLLKDSLGYSEKAVSSFCCLLTTYLHEFCKVFSSCFEAFSGFEKGKVKKANFVLSYTLEESYHQSLLKRRQKDKIKKYQQKWNRIMLVVSSKKAQAIGTVCICQKIEVAYQEENQERHSLISLSLQNLQIAAAFPFPSNVQRKTLCCRQVCVNSQTQNSNFKTRRINFRLHFFFRSSQDQQLSRHTFCYRKSSTNVKAFKTVYSSLHTQFSHGLHIWHTKFLHRLVFPWRD